MDPVRYATRDVYAEVPEEGGPVNRLVAVNGQPVPAGYAHLVNDEDTTTDLPNVVPVLAETRGTSARRDAAAAAAAEEGASELEKSEASTSRRRKNSG